MMRSRFAVVQLTDAEAAEKHCALIHRTEALLLGDSQAMNSHAEMDRSVSGGDLST